MPAAFCLSSSHHPSRPGWKTLVAPFLEEHAPGKPRAVYIGAAHDDDQGFARKTLRALEKTFGIACEWPRLSDPGLDVAGARAAIAGAEFVYLDGGDPVACVRHARERGLAEALKAAGGRAKAVIALSAGALAAAPCTIGWAGDDDEVGRVEPALDMGPPLPMDAHDEEAHWPEMRALLRLLARGRGPTPAQGIVLPTGSTLIVRPDRTLHSWPAGPRCERRSLAADDSWVIAPIEAG